MQIPLSSAFRTRVAAMTGSLLVGLMLMAAKFYVYRLTHSSAVLSDALESIINVIASGFALGSVIFSAKPPDTGHPYGHGKIEYFSAGFEGALIILAAFGIFRTAWPQILHPHPLPHLELGLVLLLGTSAANLILGIVLVRVGKKTVSLAVLADGRHVLTDVITSIGVLAGLLLVRLTGWYWMDGAVAAVLGLHILVSGGRLVKTSFSGLMDAADLSLLDEIAALIARHRKETWIDVHRLRAWRAGERLFVDFHLILPRNLPLHAAHTEVKALEGIFRERFGAMVEVMIHVDPCSDPQCQVCAESGCGLRKHPTHHQYLWDRNFLTAEFPHDQDTTDHHPRDS
ncbi:cation diffusion facilitator family transporter [Desulfoglaeba alkanexedens]|nr:cation diffusion facilitator family transporter [Desulfoglaeba alkanexedens]